jgi:PrtD family type I secretion system ABC transporter
MNEVASRFRSYFAHAAFFSVFINLALLLPMIYMLQVFDRVLVSRSVETLVMLSLAVGVGLLTMFLLEVVRQRILLAAGEGLDRLLGGKVVAALVENAARVVRPEYVYGLRDVATLRSFVTGSNVIALFDAPWLVVFVAVIYLFHPLMGLIAAVGAVLLFLLAWVNERTNRAPLEAMRDATRRAGQLIDTGLRNADAVNGLGMAPALVARWEKMNADVLERFDQTTRRMGLIGAATKFLRQVIYIAMLGAGAYLIVAQNLTAGVMLAATILVGRALAPVESLIGNWNGLVQARAAFNHLNKYLPNLLAEVERTELPPPRGHLRVEGVALAGRSPDQPIIRQAAFELPAGEALGIVGPSGSGKSSLAKLIVGVWRPTVGHVRLDGADVSQWDRADLGPHVGYLPQDVELMPGTVAENIARLGAVDSEAVVDAAQRANVHDLIVHLPNGYDTLIGERGVMLSPGQAQRVALARALYGQPRLVVLDEPNANLDGEGEAALLRTLETLRQEGATVILITHRPSLVGTMDKLLVVNAGRTETFGPREQVLATLAGGARPAPFRAPAIG